MMYKSTLLYGFGGGIGPPVTLLNLVWLTLVAIDLVLGGLLVYDEDRYNPSGHSCKWR